MRLNLYEASALVDAMQGNIDGHLVFKKTPHSYRIEDRNEMLRGLMAEPVSEDLKTMVRHIMLEDGCYTHLELPEPPTGHAHGGTDMRWAWDAAQGMAKLGICVEVRVETSDDGLFLYASLQDPKGRL